MCGIAGAISFREDMRERTAALREMQAVLRRRGPDQQGIVTTTHAGLVHTRLAVIDPEHGRQPMTVERAGERFTIVYNGELYNTAELRHALEAAGETFETRSDTEVVLRAYAVWGAACVEKCNGIFAFAVWEHGAERLFLARDRMGVKPLFYHLTDERLVFGSELKAVLAWPDVPHEVDAEGVSQLMLFGPGRSPGCGVFRGIREVKAAQCGHYSRADGLHLWTYWSLRAREHKDSFAQTAEHVRYLVTDAIERQLVSDVPLGTFLSGGLDSSLISSVASRMFQKEGRVLPTFSVDYQGNDKYFKASKFQPNSDPAYIRQMAAYLDTEHHWTVVENDALVQALYTATEARDLPGMADVDASLLLFAGDIRQHVTVALSGECADELFGGYPWYRDPEIRAAYGFPWSQSTAYRMGLLRPEVADVLAARGDVDRAYRATLADTDTLPTDSADAVRMREMMRLNTDWFMQTLLDRKDRMTMWNALEVRVPFCDYRIAEYLYNVPWEMKEHGGYEKGLLREAMRGYLPDEILWRKKSPYPKTHDPAFRTAVTRELEARLADPQAPLWQLVRRDALERLLYGDEDVQWYGQLMTRPQTIAYLLALDWWMVRYAVKVVL